MCLETISKIKPKSWGYGWKVFVVKQGKLYSLYSHITGNQSYPVNKWLQAQAIHFDYDGAGHQKYIPQFHILLDNSKLLTRSDLDPYDTSSRVRPHIKMIKGTPTLRKIRYRKAQVQGQDSTYSEGKCVVAGEIYIYKKKGDK